MNLEKKTVLITGASRGIGAATAEVFAKNGYNVVINYNNSKSKAVALKDKLEKEYTTNITIIKADVSNEEQVKNMVEEIIKEYKKIDVLVNNAGVLFDKDFKDRTLEDFQRTFEVNVFGVFLVTKYVSKYMLEAKKGKIINISSTNGIDTLYPTSIDYDATKSAVISLTKNMALEFAPYLTVNSVAPGWTNTDMNAGIPEEDIPGELERIALKRYCEPIEIANVVYFLSTEEANYINGEIIRVDGGMI